MSTSCRNGHLKEGDNLYEYRGQAHCRACRREAHARYNSSDSGGRALWRQGIERHGLSVEQFNRLVEECGGRCEICGRVPERRLYIDHDHACCPGAYSCGQCIRGLLCATCNAGIAQLQENPEILRSALRYLGEL